MQLYSRSSIGIQEECNHIQDKYWVVFPGFENLDAFLDADYQVNGLIVFEETDKKVYTYGTYVNPALRGRRLHKPKFVQELWINFMHWNAARGIEEIITGPLNDAMASNFLDLEKHSPFFLECHMYDAQSPYYEITLTS